MCCTTHKVIWKLVLLLPLSFLGGWCAKAGKGCFGLSPPHTHRFEVSIARALHQTPCMSTTYSLHGHTFVMWTGQMALRSFTCVQLYSEGYHCNVHNTYTLNACTHYPVEVGWDFETLTVHAGRHTYVYIHTDRHHNTTFAI